MGGILRETLRTHLPEARLFGDRRRAARRHHARAAATRGALLAGLRLAGTRSSRQPEPLVIHSSRERRDLHEIIVASCYIPLLYAGVARLDGALHLDGALADNTLLDALLARGADDITVITPFAGGAVAHGPCSRPRARCAPPPHVRLRVLYPERPLSLGRFDFSRSGSRRRWSMPHATDHRSRTARMQSPPARVQRGYISRVSHSPVRIATLTLSDTRTARRRRGRPPARRAPPGRGLRASRSHAIVREDARAPAAPR